ncbi:hypothetical protein Poly24_19470 [Rosistilla carotiformis]|uniref:DUF4404 domain-containing protein n=1 Tax=Rosistilla carotiformis TaxID=2528017 RepID=A0A518JRS8_9BACT|nr:DUF4404 family protein [Rosistilla carotiformis]QDV68238.1 hypothetical protein Poly24_19470 [Rosistilla carotiformis]
MPEDQLGQELERLHAMLAAQEELTDEQREKLQQLADDIEAALGKSDAPTDFGDQIDELIRDFEVNHPTVTDLLRRIVDGLANLGI